MILSPGTIPLDEVTLSSDIDQLMHSQPQDFLTKFESQLSKFVRAYSRSFPTQLRLATNYTLLQSSKRLRPQLVEQVARYLSNSKKKIFSDELFYLACAIESLHNFTLIHDDLPALDNAISRRSLPANHIKFGEANAILAGDALIVLAQESLRMFMKSRSYKPSDHANVLFYFNLEFKAVLSGQGSEFNNKLPQNKKALLKLFEAKTGSLFGIAAAFGAILAKEPAAKWHRFGQELGIAYQIKDDLEDGDLGPTPPQTHITYHGSKEYWENELKKRTRLLTKKFSKRNAKESMALRNLIEAMLA